MARVLLVEDAPQDLEVLRDELAAMGHEVATARTLAAARRALDARPDLVVSDIRLPDGLGTALLDTDDRPPVVFVTAYGEVEEAVEAMRRGAFHYLQKPVRAEELAVVVERALRAAETQAELERLRRAEGSRAAEEELVARSAAMREVVETIRAAAESDATVLLLGESGTGKEVLARLLHRLSPRAEGPFVAVNCGAIPATLLEADLFGHEKGAFTGAANRRIGKFERAHGGTLFLDEIGTLPAELQVRLLRAIQEREIERLGGEKPIRVDFRLVAATNLDLEAAVRNGTFREDLYYRIHVIAVRIPPLRERKDEIPALVAHFLAARGAADRPIAPDAMERLLAYDWPGNVRELENALERALVLSRGGPIGLAHLPEGIRKAAPAPPRAGEAGDDFPTLEELKRRHVLSALSRAGGKREEAARLLGIHRNTLRALLQKYGAGGEA